MKKYLLNAYNLGREIDLEEIDKKLGIPLYLKKRREVILKKNDEEFIFIYYFGAAVLFNVPEAEQKKLVDQILKQAVKIKEERTSEEYNLIVGDSDVIDYDEATIDKFSVKKIGVIAYILAQSVAIERLETVVEESLNKIEDINKYLEAGGKLKLSNKDILKLIGQNSNIIRETIANLSLLDKPDVVWEHKGLEKLFISCRTMFELDDRFENLKFKADYIQNNLKTITDVLTSKRLEVLEWAIVILIVIEILLYLFEIVYLR